MKARIFAGTPSYVEGKFNEWLESGARNVQFSTTFTRETFVLTVLYSESGKKERVRGEEAPGQPPVCPNCGQEMVERTRHSDKKSFWGCSGFPECRGVVSFDEDDVAAQKAEIADQPSSTMERGKDDPYGDDDVPF
jgi:ribosomal protein L37AE/L43A